MGRLNAPPKDVASGPGTGVRVFRRVVIDVPNRRFLCRRGLLGTAFAWSDCRVESLGPAASLVDEVGASLTGPDARFVLAETTPGFWGWFEETGLARELPTDWYERAERGELFTPTAPYGGR